MDSHWSLERYGLFSKKTFFVTPSNDVTLFAVFKGENVLPIFAKCDIDPRRSFRFPASRGKFTIFSSKNALYAIHFSLFEIRSQFSMCSKDTSITELLNFNV